MAYGVPSAVHMQIAEPRPCAGRTKRLRLIFKGDLMLCRRQACKVSLTACLHARATCNQDALLPFASMPSRRWDPRLEAVTPPPPQQIAHNLREAAEGFKDRNCFQRSEDTACHQSQECPQLQVVIHVSVVHDSSALLYQTLPSTARYFSTACRDLPCRAQHLQRWQGRPA